MNNKVLAIFWVIILTGVVIIGIKLFKPENAGEKPLQTNETTITEEEKIPETISGTYSEYITKGDNDLNNGNLKSAIENYQKAVALNPKSAKPLTKLAKAYLLNNEPKNAETTYLKALAFEPNSLEIKLGIAQSYLNQRNIQEAKNLVWQLDKNNFEVKYYSGLILVLYKDFDGAKKIFQEINSAQGQIPNEIRTNSKNFLAAYENFSSFAEGSPLHLQTLLAKAFTESGQFESAIPLLFDVLNQKNNYRDAWIVLGFAYLNTNKTPDAIDSFLQAKTLDPEKPETLFFLGLSYFGNNNYDKAIYYLKAADKAGYPNKDEIKLKLGDLYMLQENYQDAAMKYEEVLAVNQSNIEIFTRVVWIYIEKLNNPKKALANAQIALNLFPENAMSFNLAGWALTANQNYDDAEGYLNKALQLNPNLAAAYLNYGWLYEKQTQTALAQEYYRKAYDLGGTSSVANLAAIRFNNLQSLQVNISAPSAP